MSLRQYSHRNKRIICAGLFLLTLSAFPRPSCAALTSLEIYTEAQDKHEVNPAWFWVNDFDEYRRKFGDKYGTNFAFLVNYTQQLILRSGRGGGKGRGVWYWNLEIAQRLWPGGELFAEFEVDRGKGVDKFLPTFSGFNDNSGFDANLYIPALYLEQKLFQEKVFIAAGKLDLSYWFDCNNAANSADTQFLSGGLVNSLTLPFPAKGIGALAGFKPYEWLYFQSGASTARASSTKMGISDAFNSAFIINELGFTPKIGELEGNYRFIFNINHEELGYVNSDETKKNDFGFALSFDQAVTSRVTLFLRYGFGDQKVRDIEHFWSCGAQLTEPIPGRKFDILGIGAAQSIFGSDYRKASDEDTGQPETIYEVYYSFNLNSVCTLTPDIQVVTNPDSNRNAVTEVVCGLRFILSF